jgi:phosphoglycerate dehydrogenase-like enzyme
VCRLDSREPLAAFDAPGAATQLAEIEILVSGWGCPPLDEVALAKAPRLQLVAHAAGTVKNHVGPACFDGGIRVVAAAAANAVPVAEFTLAAILLSGKRAFTLRERYRELRSFRFWSQEVEDPGNFRKTVGVVGASHIGRRVLKALRAFDYRCLLYDPTLTGSQGEAEAAAIGAQLVELDTLLERSDIVSLHAPSLPETHHLLDAQRLALLRDGTVLINTARGALVDGEALTRELVSGRIEAVLDTTEPEVLPAGSPLYTLPNVFLTPHIAGSLARERERMVELVLDEVERFTRGEPLQHEVLRQHLDRIA